MIEELKKILKGKEAISYKYFMKVKEIINTKYDNEKEILKEIAKIPYNDVKEYLGEELFDKIFVTYIDDSWLSLSKSPIYNCDEITIIDNNVRRHSLNCLNRVLFKEDCNIKNVPTTVYMLLRNYGGFQDMLPKCKCKKCGNIFSIPQVFHINRKGELICNCPVCLNNINKESKIFVKNVSLLYSEKFNIDPPELDLEDNLYIGIKSIKCKNCGRAIFSFNRNTELKNIDIYYNLPSNPHDCNYIPLTECSDFINEDIGGNDLIYSVLNEKYSKLMEESCND